MTSLPPEVVPFERARSRIPYSEHRAAARLDPFWNYVWSRGSFAQWRSRRKMQARRDAGLGRVPHWFLPDPGTIELAHSKLHRTRRAGKLGLLGALDSWRTMTAQQAAAILGDPGVLTDRASLIRDLYALDLVDVGSDAGFSDMKVRNEDVPEWLVRPSRSHQFQRIVQPTLTYPELVKVTGGHPFITGGQYDRHNVLSVEFGLRVAEFTKCLTVLGERWSGASELMFEEWGRETPFPQLQNRGDLTLVRGDGLRIAVELTASASGVGFERKVAKWVRQMSVQPVGAQGTVVLFLVCGEQHPKPGDTDALRRQVQSAIVRAVRQHPGYPGNLTAERVFVASWSDLFPAPHAMRSDFPRLPALYPAKVAGAIGMDRVWEEAHLFDPASVPFTPANGMDVFAVRENAGALYATPHWLRTEPVPQIATDPVRELWGGTLPGVEAADLIGNGTTGRVQLPERLRL